MREAQSKPSLIFPLPVKNINPDSLISCVNQSLMAASDGMKELDGSSFGTLTPEDLQPKKFESFWNPILALMGVGCCILDEKHLDCFNEGHPEIFCKRSLVDKIINFYEFWMSVF